eukprot:TRINITY_DN42153_c0_g1_i1.p1 TRINITY_DN42153_c0_g1~~TRINITY_DN42153_c0_g1_i1.p1  ORF type:complete len:897 (+),score=436.12 TRINITY_DN42153_c0_g1_i1:48-2738(+)
MPEKWFRNESDSDESSDDEDTTNSTSDSSDDSSSDSSSSDSSSSSSKADEPSGLKAWLRGGHGAESDSDDEKRKKVVSKKDKSMEALDKQKENVINHLSNRDYGALVDDLEALLKLVTKQASKVTPAPFLSALKKFQDFYDDNDEKQLKAKMNKIQSKNYSKLRNRTKKLFVEYEDELKDYVSESDNDSSSAMSDSGSEHEGEPKKKEEKEEKVDEWTEEAIEHKLDLIKAERGKKGTKTEDLIKKLKTVLSHTGQWRHMTLYVLGILLSCQLDTAQHGASMSQNMWTQCYHTLTKMLNVIQEPSSTIIAVEEEGSKRDRTTPFETTSDGKVKVHLIFSFHQVVDRLGDEYTKALQYADPHGQEYITRLTDEGYLLDLAERVFVYYRQAGRNDIASSMAMRLMDHLYYRRSCDHVKMLAKQRKLTFETPIISEDDEDEKDEGSAEEDEEDEEDEEKEAKQKAPVDLDEKRRVGLIEQTLNQRPKTKLFVNESLSDVMRSLHKYIHKHMTEKDDKLKTKALFFYIYHLALHNHYTKARDLLLMSKKTVEYEERNMKDQDDHSRFVTNSTLMILYNRVLAQLGLAAFRAGDLNDTLVLLNELCATIRTKEHLAQAPVKSRDKLESEQKAEKAKLIPIHMHINVDVLDGVHLIAAMLYEVPSRAQYPHDTKRRPMSKAFNRLLTHFSQQVFLGPPESTKEHIYAAYLALQKGDWSTAHDHIMGLPLWGLIDNAEKVKQNITEQIKIVGLRTYLFSYSQYYATVQLGELAEKYGLEESKVHATISKMILRQQITAAWDQPQQCICVEQNSVTKLQFLSTQLAEKCVYLVEYNEQRQAEKEARHGGREGYQGHGYTSKRGRGGGRWDSHTRKTNHHRIGLQKSREVEKKKDGNPFESRSWK